jgi:STE24 endopeptidase
MFMPDPKPSEPAPDLTTEERARNYESIHNRLFLIRVLFTVLLVSAYLFSGASVYLADGLRSRFGSFWPVINGLYTLITVFGFSAVMFPLSLYSDFVLERRYGMSNQELEGWFVDYLKSLVIELFVATVFFEVIYAFLRYTPCLWWIWATFFYVVFVVVLAAIAPVVILPLFHKFEPIDNPSLTDAVKSFVEKAGLKVVGVFRWGLEEKTNAGNAALTGLGKTRRIVLGDTILKDYTQDEIVAVLAHEVGHYKHRDMARLIVAGSILAAVGFYLAHFFLWALVAKFAKFGIAGPDDIGSFPIFIFCLLVFSLVTMPISNAYSRRREYKADAYAVGMIGSAGSLVNALEKLAAQNLADKNPAPWIEFFLHGHPSISRRVRRAREIDPSTR